MAKNNLDKSKEENFVNDSQTKSSPYDFLFEDQNNEYDKEYKDYIDVKTEEELFELAFGREELERQKALRQKRMLKADYGVSELNVLECVMCGSDDVPNVDLDIDLKSRNERLISIKIRGGKCSLCGEEYYNSTDTDVVRKIEVLLEKLFPNT